MRVLLFSIYHIISHLLYSRLKWRVGNKNSYNDYDEMRRDIIPIILHENREDNNTYFYIHKTDFSLTSVLVRSIRVCVWVGVSGVG